MKIYLAGPDVFLPDAIEIGRRKVDICARHGLTGLYPLDNAVDLAASSASLEIFKGNEAMMDAADAIIANLTPFRGPSADAGTVYELGYAAGRGKFCLAYSNDPTPYRDRVARIYDVTTSADGRLVDDAGKPSCVLIQLHTRRQFVSGERDGPCARCRDGEQDRVPRPHAEYLGPIDTGGRTLFRSKDGEGVWQLGIDGTGSHLRL